MGGLRLNGWQRIGIALSVVWAVAGGLYALNSHQQRALSLSDLTYQSCAVKANRHNYDFATCRKQSDEVFEAFMKGSRGDAALTGLAPIPIAWLLAFALIAFARWVRRGFQPST